MVDSSKEMKTEDTDFIEENFDMDEDDTQKIDVDLERELNEAEKQQYKQIVDDIINPNKKD